MKVLEIDRRAFVNDRKEIGPSSKDRLPRQGGQDKRPDCGGMCFKFDAMGKAQAKVDQS